MALAILEGKLKPSHRKFVDYYLETWNAAESAKLCGYSEATAKQGGYKILHRPDVQAVLEKALDFEYSDWLMEISKCYRTMPESNAKLRALELIGKAKGFLGNDGAQVNVALFSVAERALGNNQIGFVKSSSTISGSLHANNAPNLLTNKGSIEP